MQGIDLCNINFVTNTIINETFVYDKAGNRIQRSIHDAGEVQTDCYSYGLLNELNSITRKESSQSVNFSYDTDGNKLVCRYDAEGLRYEMEENETLIRFIYSGRDVVYEEGEQESSVRYIRGNGRVIASDVEHTRTYYHYASDDLGSITHIISMNEESVRESANVDSDRIAGCYDYDAFGNRIYETEELSNRYGFSGEIYDRISGLYYLRARYYHPEIGRFTQPDSYHGDGLNLYAYVGNNPVKYVDPSGHCRCGKENGVESGSYTRGYDVKPKNSSYQIRINGTPGDPSKNGKWTGLRGESMFVSSDSRVKDILSQHGVKGVEYKNGMPDFSPFAVAEVKLKNMTDYRPTNFKEADAELAAKWSTDKKTYTAEDIESWRKENNYTWHELNDVETIQLVPTDINRPIFRHFGGCAEYGLMEEF